MKTWLVNWRLLDSQLGEIVSRAYIFHSLISFVALNDDERSELLFATVLVWLQNRTISELREAGLFHGT